MWKLIIAIIVNINYNKHMQTWRTRIHPIDKWKYIFIYVMNFYFFYYIFFYSHNFDVNFQI